MGAIRHIFLTPRSQPLPRWLEAFPDAVVLPCPKSGTILVSRPGEALVWLHLGKNEKKPAELLRSVALAAPSCHIVVLSNLPSEQEGVSCLESGAAGYISALAVPELLRQVATVVENGGLWVGVELIARLRTALAAKEQEIPGRDKLELLSRREREVALAVAGGATNKEVAKAMGITERTVKAHLSAIFERLGVRDRLQLSILVNSNHPDVAHKEYVH